MTLVTALSIQGRDGTDVPLIATSRRCKYAEGLIGMRTREVVVDATGRHGSVNLSRLRRDQEIHLTIVLTGSTPMTEYWAVSAALSGTVGQERLLKYTIGGVALQAMVEVIEVSAPIIVGPDLIEVDVSLRASDPRGYSQTQKSQGINAVSHTHSTATIVNAGTVESPLLFRITGPGGLRYVVIQLTDAPTIAQVSFNSDAPALAGAGNWLEIDMAARTFTREDGSNAINLYYPDRTRWFDLPPRAAGYTLDYYYGDTASSGSPKLSCKWRDAYQ